jgi:cytochrome c peroxidase
VKAQPDADFPSYGLVTAQYVGGKVQKFDDLPAPHRKNLDTQLPLDGRAASSKAPMSEQPVNDLICFLRTLTDADVVAAVAPPMVNCAD